VEIYGPGGDLGSRCDRLSYTTRTTIRVFIATISSFCARWM